MLKRKISDSKKLGALGSDSARLLYTWIIPWLDVEGRHTADPDLIKGRIFPKIASFTPQKIEQYLKELNEIGLIILYKIKDDAYLQLKKFHSEQKINRAKEAETKIPPPPRDSGPTPEDSGPALENSLLSLSLSSSLRLSKSLNKEKEKDQEKKRNVPNQIDIDLTQLLINKILENDIRSSSCRKMTEENQRTWIDDCRKLREIDERTPAEIKAIIEWCQNDNFWKANILSMGTLRKKFDRLFLQAKRDTGEDDLSGIRAWLKEQGAIK